jgi:hypothetical protein
MDCVPRRVLGLYQNEAKVSAGSLYEAAALGLKAKRRRGPSATVSVEETQRKATGFPLSVCHSLDHGARECSSGSGTPAPGNAAQNRIALNLSALLLSAVLRLLLVPSMAHVPDFPEDLFELPLAGKHNSQ